jgi:hypothetical protein
MTIRRSCWTLIALAALAAGAHAEETSWTAIAVGRTDYQIWSGDTQRFNLEMQVIGPNWTNARQSALSQAVDGRRVYEETIGFAAGRGQTGDELQGLEFDVRFEAVRKTPSSFVLTTRTASNQDTKAIGVGLIVATTDYFSGGTGTVVAADGTSSTLEMPLGMGRHGDTVSRIVLQSPTGREVVLSFSRPLKVTSDRGELRIWYWADQIAKDEPQEAEITITFPAPIEFETANRVVDTSGWLKFASQQEFAPGSPIGAEEWLDTPAGSHGYVQVKGDRFVCEDGTEIKFWGTNIAYARMAVEPEVAEQWADKFAKYGVNLVRLHKFTGNAGWDGLMSQEDALDFDEPRCRQFDDIHAKFRQRGIYTGWSPIFALKFHESYRSRLIAYDELLQRPAGGMFGKTLYPFSTFAPDVQDLYIELIVKWLDRKNTVTGLRYADDPALAYVELHNEADIFFYGTGKLVRNFPTYTKMMEQRFCQWLAKKYANDDALRAAWGNDLARDESIAEQNIFPFPNYQGQMPAPRRVADSYAFLYEFQTEFYQRAVAAIRKTGYRGAIVGGCWQASDMYGHLLNVASDREVGFIDRHNYFKGERPMITLPGSALLSAGMQQVGDRPFGLSEWAGGHVFAAECQPILGLIGLGLQGWDLSAQFASSNSILLPDNEGGINGNFDEFRSTAQHPFIARFLYGGGLREGGQVASRRISFQELYSGKIGFEERFSLLGGANLKTFSGSVPNEALGAGRVTIDFVDEPAEKAVDMSALSDYWDKDRKILRANNGQIVWDYSGRGFLTVDTPPALTVIGFGANINHEFSTATIRYDNPFANVYVAARKPGQSLAEAEQIVILMLARTCNEGDLLDETSMQMLQRQPREIPGRSPAEKNRYLFDHPRLLIEPVRGTIAFKRTEPCRVYALDHDGRMPANPAPVPVTAIEGSQRVTLDGAKTNTMYYLVEFGP